MNAVAVMQSPTLWRLSLGLAGVLGCGMALYHTVLPYHLQWARGLAGVPDSLVWALFALNFSWSIVVFIAGTLVIYASRLGPAAGRFATRTVFAIGSFWFIHGAYTWWQPLPLPASLGWLGVLLGAFPLAMAALHWLPIAVYRHRRHG